MASAEDVVAGKPPTEEQEAARHILGHPVVYAMTKGASRPSYIPRERFVSALLGRGGETRAKVFAALGSGGDASATTQKVLEGLPAGELKRGLTATWVKAKRDVSTFRPLAEEWYAGAPAAAAKVRALIADLPDGPIKKAMQTLWIEAGSDADAFRKEAEGWFDEAMQRLSGSYKRHTQVWLWGVGFAFALLLDVDTIRIANALWQDQTLRQLLVDQAQHAPSSGTAAADQLSTLGLPLGVGRLAERLHELGLDGDRTGADVGGGVAGCAVLVRLAGQAGEPAKRRAEAEVRRGGGLAGRRADPRRGLESIDAEGSEEIDGHRAHLTDDDVEPQGGLRVERRRGQAGAAKRVLDDVSVRPPGELCRQALDRLRQLTDAVREAGRRCVAGLERRPRRSGQDADVPHGVADVRCGERVALDVGDRGPLGRREEGGLAGLPEQLLEAGVEARGGIRAGERERSGRGVALVERRRDIDEDVPDVGQRRLERPAKLGERIPRGDDEHGEADEAPHERVDETRRRGVRRRECGDQHRRAGGLRRDQPPAAEHDRRADREQHDEADLERARPDGLDDRVADRDAEGDAEHHLNRSTAAFSGDDSEDDGRRDRCEVRVGVPDQVVRDEPRKARGDRHLDDLPASGPQRRGAQPHVHPHPRREGFTGHVLTGILPAGGRTRPLCRVAVRRPGGSCRLVDVLGASAPETLANPLLPMRSSRR